MVDKNETSTAPDETTIVTVVPVTTDDNPSDGGELASITARLDAIEARLDAIEAWQVAHSEAHISDLEREIDEEETDNDRADDDNPEPERDREGEEEGETPEVIDRPIRRGIGGFLFGPVRRR